MLLSKVTQNKSFIAIIAVILLVSTALVSFLVYRNNQFKQTIEISPEKLDETKEVNLRLDKSAAPGNNYLACTLGEVIFLEPSNYLVFDNFKITILGECGYHDQKNNYQQISLALSIEDRDANATWFATLLQQPVLYTPKFRQEFFNKTTKFEPNKILLVELEYPDNEKIINNQLIKKIHQPQQFVKFIETKNPKEFGQVLVSSSIAISEFY